MNYLKNTNPQYKEDYIPPLNIKCVFFPNQAAELPRIVILPTNTKPTERIDVNEVLNHHVLHMLHQLNNVQQHRNPVITVGSMTVRCLLTVQVIFMFRGYCASN